MLVGKYLPHSHTQDGNGKNTEESVKESGYVPHSDSDERVGGEKPTNISLEISNEPNGGNYERKGLSNLFLVNSFLFRLKLKITNA